jgi:hypothetical protein
MANVTFCCFNNLEDNNAAKLFCDSYAKHESFCCKGKLLEEEAMYDIKADIMILLEFKRGWSAKPPRYPFIRTYKEDTNMFQYPCNRLKSNGLKIVLTINMDEAYLKFDSDLLEKQLNEQNNSELRKLIHEKSNKFLIQNLGLKDFSLSDARKVINCLFSDDPIGEIDKLIKQKLLRWA